MSIEVFIDNIPAQDYGTPYSKSFYNKNYNLKIGETINMSERKSMIATPMFISNLEAILNELVEEKDYVATIGNLTIGIMYEDKYKQLFYIEKKGRWYRVIELYYELEETGIVLYELYEGIGKAVGKFADREDMLEWIENTYDYASLIVKGRWYRVIEKYFALHYYTEIIGTIILIIPLALLIIIDVWYIILSIIDYIEWKRGNIDE